MRSDRPARAPGRPCRPSRCRARALSRARARVSSAAASSAICAVVSGPVEPAAGADAAVVIGDHFEVLSQRAQEQLAPVQRCAAHAHDRQQRRAGAGALVVELDLARAGQSHARILTLLRVSALQQNVLRRSAGYTGSASWVRVSAMPMSLAARIVGAPTVVARGTQTRRPAHRAAAPGARARTRASSLQRVCAHQLWRRMSARARCVRA